MITLTKKEKTWLETVTLKSGSHKNLDDGVCFMEAVSYIAGQPFSDKPPCVCPVIGAFMRSWNDSLPDGDRDRLLKNLIPVVIGTENAALTDRRAFMALDWLMRVWLPEWLSACNSDLYRVHIDALRLAPEITSWQNLIDITPTLTDLRKQAAAVRDAAWAAASAAAWDAAWDAARDAASAAAGEAAGEAVSAAASAAVRDAAWAAASAAAGDAAGDAVWAAAGAKLKPVTERLQVSAKELVRRMCEVC